MISPPKQNLCLGKTDIKIEDFKPIVNRQMFVKPYGGLWTSPYKPRHKYKSAWHEWCSYNMPGWITNDGCIITLKDDLNYYTIDSQKDLIELFNIVGEVSPIIRISPWKFLDYEVASGVFDCIYLTEKGAYETHIPMENPEYSLYGWDCESVFIMNYDAIESVRYKKFDIKCNG